MDPGEDRVKVLAVALENCSCAGLRRTMREIGGSRRTREIRITEAGKAKLEGAAPLWAEAQKVFISVLGPHNLDALEDILARTGQITDLDLDALKSQVKPQEAA